MLVLSRKVNEEIVIDGLIRVQVLQVKGKTIRLGVTAPDEVKILRGELQAFGPEASDPAATLPSSNKTRVMLANAG